MPIQDKAAFRCKNCGHLEAAEHAGENALPHACSVCGAGVTFTPQGIKIANPGNWEVLADAEPARLEELGLNADKVVKHTPKKTMSAAEGQTIEGADVQRLAVEDLGAKDKVGN